MEQLRLLYSAAGRLGWHVEVYCRVWEGASDQRVPDPTPPHTKWGEGFSSGAPPPEGQPPEKKMQGIKVGLDGPSCGWGRRHDRVSEVRRSTSLPPPPG